MRPVVSGAHPPPFARPVPSQVYACDGLIFDLRNA